MRAAASLALLGALWAGLSAWLARDGVPARFPLLPVAAEDYYAFQAVVVTPVVALLATLFAAIVHALSPRGVAFARTWAVLVPAYALPLALGLVVPDLIAYAVGGVPAMTNGMRFYAPIAALAIVASSVRRVRAMHGTSTVRAIAIVVVALIVQAAAGAPILR